MDTGCRRQRDTYRCCDKCHHRHWHLTQHHPITALMDREPTTETLGKRIGPASKIQVPDDVDNACIPIRASPVRDIVQWVALQEVSYYI